MRRTVRCVRSRVLPPAPYVTDTKRGASGSRRLTARHSVSSLSGGFGGKNSNETTNGLGSDRGINKRIPLRRGAPGRRFSWLFYVAAICLEIATESIVGPSVYPDERMMSSIL